MPNQNAKLKSRLNEATKQLAKAKTEWGRFYYQTAVESLTAQLLERSEK